MLFARQYDDLQALRADLRGREEGRRAKHSAHHLQAIAQHARRWPPFGRMVKLAIVLAADGSALVGAQKSQELARCWKQTFETEHAYFQPVVAAVDLRSFVSHGCPPSRRRAWMQTRSRKSYLERGTHLLGLMA